MAKAGRKKKEEVEVIDTSIITIELPENNTTTTSESTESVVTLESAEITPPFTYTELKEERKMPEVFMPQRRMSEQATKWEKYIAMYNFTPESFLERYPNHVNKRFIEEIITFKKKQEL